MKGAVRAGVRQLLQASPAFRQLPSAKRRELARDLERVSEYLAAPEGVSANTLPGAVGVAPFQQLVESVDFPAFVASLINGVFNAIVGASIQQMSAYGELLKNVAKTVDQFVKDNVSDQHGRDYLAERYPDVFETGSDGCLRLREEADPRSAIERLRRLFPREKIAQLDSSTIKRVLIPAARKRIAASRQQLLASMVLMGINRIHAKRRRSGRRGSEAA